MTLQVVGKADASDIGATSRAARSKGNGYFSVGSVGALASRCIDGPSIAGGIDGGNVTKRRRVGYVNAAFPDRREAVGVNRRAAGRGPAAVG